MPKFIFAYHGGTAPESPEQRETQMAAWSAWFAAIGPALAQPGAPVAQSRTVNAGGVTSDGGANPVSGYTVINAASIDAATDMAKGCPMVGDGTGSVEVGELMEM